MPLLQNLATDFAAHRVGIIWTRPFIADDWTLFKEGMNPMGCVDKFAFYEAGKVVVYIPDYLNSQLHDSRIISAPLYSARFVAYPETALPPASAQGPSV
jgi:hypothetical protein